MSNFLNSGLDKFSLPDNPLKCYFVVIRQTDCLKYADLFRKGIEALYDTVTILNDGVNFLNSDLDEISVPDNPLQGYFVVRNRRDIDFLKYFVLLH